MGDSTAFLAESKTEIEYSIERIRMGTLSLRSLIAQVSYLYMTIAFSKEKRRLTHQDVMELYIKIEKEIEKIFKLYELKEKEVDKHDNRAAKEEHSR